MGLALAGLVLLAVTLWPDRGQATPRLDPAAGRAVFAMTPAATASRVAPPAALRARLAPLRREFERMVARRPGVMSRRPTPRALVVPSLGHTCEIAAGGSGCSVAPCPVEASARSLVLERPAGLPGLERPARSKGPCERGVTRAMPVSAAG